MLGQALLVFKRDSAPVAVGIGVGRALLTDEGLFLAPLQAKGGLAIPIFQKLL